MRKCKIVSWFYLLILLASVFGCGHVENVPENSFYERSALDEEEIVKDYSNKVDEIYNEAYDRFTEPGYSEEMEGADIFEKVSRYLLGGYHRIYRVFRTNSSHILITSLVIGFGMMGLARKNKKIQRTGLVVFVIGIPAIIIIVVFGVGILNDVLLY